MSAALLHRLKPAVSVASRVWSCKPPRIEPSSAAASVRLYSGLMEPRAPLFRQVSRAVAYSSDTSENKPVFVCLIAFRKR